MEWMQYAVAFMEIVLINLLLSGDNAVVIAMAGRQLPAHQRRRAVWWGAAAAVGLRVALTFAAVSLLAIPYLQTVGAALLIVVALQLLLGGKEDPDHARAAATLAGAIWTIVAADFVMSLDNVLAVAAVANGDYGLIAIGIAMSIPIIIWGSQFIMRLMDRLPGLVYLGGALLAYAAGDMALHDPGLRRWLPAPGDWEKALPFVAAAALIAAALLMRSRRKA